MTFNTGIQLTRKMEELDNLLDSKKKDPVILFIAAAFSKLLDDVYPEVFEQIGYLRSALFLITFLSFYLIISYLYKRYVNKIKALIDKWKKSEIEKLKNSEIESEVHKNNLKDKYKGVITFVSIPPRDDKTEEQWVIECKNKINRYPENKKEILCLSGIGQTFRAILHHDEKLTHIWLIYTKKSKLNLQIIDYFLKNVIKRKLTIIPIEIENENDVVHVKAKIDAIYKNLPKDFEVKDVIADITSGTKIMTSAMFLSCLPADRNIEYVEQNNNELIEVSIFPRFTGLELESIENRSQQNKD